jgi:hypothetical protein
LTDIGRRMRAFAHPDQVEFYTSGRASNEAAFLFQLFARAYGTNNFPDCSNMCHEPTSVGLPRSIGIGKGTVSLEDFDHSDLILSIGHNPGPLQAEWVTGKGAFVRTSLSNQAHYAGAGSIEPRRYRRPRGQANRLTGADRGRSSPCAREISPISSGGWSVNPVA